jgi:hypothetical protein
MTTTSSAPSTRGTPTTLVAREPADLLAAVPVILGFRPEESLVMLTFGAAGDTFHARVDLPPPGLATALDDAVRALLAPCLAHRVERVVFLVYADDAPLAAGLAAALVPAFVAGGIDVLHVLRAHDGRWCRVPMRAGGRESLAEPYDDAGHPFAAQAVLQGHVTYASREELRSQVAPDADLRERWSRLLERLPVPGPEDAAVACAVLDDQLRSGGLLDDHGAVQVLRVVTRPDVRDTAIGAVSRATARRHLELWVALLRGAPDPQVPDTAAVVAFCAWLAGDGALAWCALDRCFEVDPDHLLGTCLAECLVRALSPAVWEEVGSRSTLPLPSRPPLD